MICPSCGNEVDGTSSFCFNCGEMLEVADAKPIKPEKKIKKPEKLIKKPAKMVKEPVEVTEALVEDALPVQPVAEEPAKENEQPVPVVVAPVIDDIQPKQKVMKPEGPKVEKKVTRTAPKKDIDDFEPKSSITQLPHFGLFCVLGVFILALIIIIIFLLVKMNTAKKSDGEVVEETTESVIYEEPVEVIEEEPEVEEEIVYEVTEGNEADYSNPQVQDSSKYNYYSSGIKDFGFAYPASLFNEEYKSYDEAEGHYGTVIQEIHYSGSDGSFVNFVLTERTESSSIDGMLSNAASFERSFICDPLELVYALEGNYGEVAYRGYTDDAHSAETFNMTKVDDEYVMQMKLYYPAPANDADASAKEYYLKSMYQLCDFGKANIPDMSEGSEDAHGDQASGDAALSGIDTSYGGSEYGWSQAYFDYMQALDGGDDYWYAGLIYVNNDDVPELVLEGNCEAVGYLILTYKNGKIDELYTNRLVFDYIERGNVLRNAGGHMGYAYENVYTIENGRWKQILGVEGTDEDMPETEYDPVFTRAYENGTIGSTDCPEVYESMIDYLLYIDG